MEISKNAWHYKILMDETKTKIRNGTSLCKYFWSVVFAIFAWIMIAGLGTLAAVGVCFVIYWFFYVWYFMIAGQFGVESFVVPDIEISIGLHGLILLGWLVSMVIRVNNKWKDKPKSDNLAFEYIKAKKQKICPIIEFRD